MADTGDAHRSGLAGALRELLTVDDGSRTGPSRGSQLQPRDGSTGGWRHGPSMTNGCFTRRRMEETLLHQVPAAVDKGGTRQPRRPVGGGEHAEMATGGDWQFGECGRDQVRSAPVETQRATDKWAPVGLNFFKTISSSSKF
jgi:hypothetical protein